MLLLSQYVHACMHVCMFIYHTQIDNNTPWLVMCDFTTGSIQLCTQLGRAYGRCGQSVAVCVQTEGGTRRRRRRQRKAGRRLRDYCRFERVSVGDHYVLNDVGGEMV